MEEGTIAEIRARMESGALTARVLTEMFLQRIEDIDRAGPRLNAVIECNPDARAIAASLDSERKAGEVRGPLHGIPVLLKDNIDTHDRMSTTAGSLALEGSVAPRDAFLVSRLRAAGALVLGKTNLSEWANARGRRSSSGWSSRGGLTRNPHALDRTASGSSSGSAAAVAAGLCAAAVGTETDGSIISPASACGIVGIKPTLGLVSRSGIVPIAHSQDTDGPMARTVADAAVLLGAMAGPDPADRATRRGAKPALAEDYRAFLDPRGLRGARLGVARGLFGSDARIAAIVESSLDAMRAAGAVIVDPVPLKVHPKLGARELQVLVYELGDDLNAYLAARGPGTPVHSLADVVAFNRANAARVMPYFGQEFMERALDRGPRAEATYRAALVACRKLARDEGLAAAFGGRRLDALVCPSGGPAWLIDLVNGDCSGGDVASTTLPAVAGWPHVTVPAGFIHGLPVGLSFIGRPWQEPALIRIAYAFEQATQARRPPRFLPTAPLDPPGRARQ